MSLIIPVSPPECQLKSWKTYLKEAVSKPHQLLAQLELSPQQLGFDLDLNNPFAMRVPQPFIDKMRQGDPNDPLLLQVIPQASENLKISGFSDNPLQENGNQTPGLLHKYHARVLLILASACAINCRYCFRRHFPYQEQLASGSQLDTSLEYIAARPTITEVILSGGEPLIVSDDFLIHLMDRLQQIPHLQRLRIHTRLPVVIPQRITQELCQAIKSSRLKTSLVLHINHPNEIDRLLESYLKRLRASGVQLLNQSVLLKNINNCANTLSELSEKLYAAGILPYYIHRLDKVAGAAHFEIGEQHAIALIQQLRSRLPGYLVPRLASEDAGKDAKILLA